MSSEGENCQYFDTGAFKRSPKTVQQIIEEKKDLLENPKENAGQVLDKFEIPDKNEICESNQYELDTKPSSKTDWTHLADSVGVRPSINKHSINRYSVPEWKRHNKSILDRSQINSSNINEFNAYTTIMKAHSNIDKGQQENNRRLKQRAKDVFKWKVEDEIACKAISKELEALTLAKQQITRAIRQFLVTESVSKECIELRRHRDDCELVMDEIEVELTKENELILKAKDTYATLLQKVDDQLANVKAAKHKIEYDWCDKTVAYKTDTDNLGLNNKSQTPMFRHGATKFGEYTAHEPVWEYYNRENINNIEAVRQASMELRSQVKDILRTTGIELRQQADKTEIAFAKNITLTNELLTKMQEHLRFTLKTLANNEALIKNLQEAIIKTDKAMKLAQTRLDNRNNGRPHGESVRDKAHFGLIHEVKSIHETVSSLLFQLKSAEDMNKNLVEKRGKIERDIAAKLKLLNIDRERCGSIRSHYPNASELAGL